MPAKGRKQGTKRDAVVKRGAVEKRALPKKKNGGGRRRQQEEEGESSGLEKAREEGFELIQTAGDGNCLFRAVSTGLFGTPRHHVLMRRTAVQYQRTNAADFEPFVTLGMETGREMRRGTRAARSAARSSSSAFERRLDQMYKDGVWGDELEVRALASYFHVAIKVYRLEGEIFEYNTEAKQGPIRLYFDSAASHYSSLYKSGTKPRAVLDFEAEKKRYLAGFKKSTDDDNVSTRSTSSKRSFSERDEEEAGEEDQPRKKAASGSRSQSPARRKASAVSRKGNMKGRQGRDKVSPTPVPSSSGVSDVDNSGNFSPASAATSTPPSSADEAANTTTTNAPVAANPGKNNKAAPSSPPSEPELSAKEQRAVRKALAAKQAAAVKRVAKEVAEEIKKGQAERRAARGMKSAAVDIVGGAGRVEKRRRTRSAERMVLKQEVPSRRHSSPSIMSQLDGAMDVDVKARSGSRLSTPSDTSSNSGWSFMAHLEL